jgi:hypothetical protein
VFEAAVGGLVVCVLSSHVRTELTEVLGRPKFGSMTPDAVDLMFQRLWNAARWVDMAADDPKYVRFVHDPKDVPLLRTAVGTFFHQDLAAMPNKFIVSSDGRAFRKGVNWNGFMCCSATEFMRMLRDTIPDSREG